MATNRTRTKTKWGIVMKRPATWNPGDTNPVPGTPNYDPYIFRAKKINDYINKDKSEIPGYLDPSNLLIEDFASDPTQILFDRPLVKGIYSLGIGIDDHERLEDELAGVEPSRSVLIQDLINRSAPDRYQVSLPVMAVELLESVTIFKFVTNNVASLVGSGYLKYNFGLLPFVSDLRKLRNITKAIEFRIKEFNSLLGEGGLSRKVPLFEDSVTKTSGKKYLTTSYATIVKGRYRTTYQTRIWGSVRWFPKDSTQIPVEPLEQFNKAVRTVLDLNELDWETIWQAVPFSWLADYFVTIGSTLAVQQTLDNFIPKHVCLMWEREATSVVVDFTSSRPEEVTLKNPGKGTYRTRSRSVVSEAELIDAESPGFAGFMSPHEAQNLLALLASMSKRKSVLNSIISNIKR